METTKLIISLDVGTTTIRSYIYNGKAEVVGKAERKLKVLIDEEGQHEMDEEEVFNEVVNVITQSVSNARVNWKDISCIGITTQRNTFTTWNRKTSEVFHPLITWKDTRCRQMVDRINQSFKIRMFRMVCGLGHYLSGNDRLKTASNMMFKCAHTSMRLKWVMETNKKLREHLKDPIKRKYVLFGTLDTWLLWKLTKASIHATDYSMASSTGLFDPYYMTWNRVTNRLLNIPSHILPPIYQTSLPPSSLLSLSPCSSSLSPSLSPSSPLSSSLSPSLSPSSPLSSPSFQSTHPSIFGIPIPITAMVADQQASMFGQCCFEKGDVKCTFGTGTFIDCNTGNKPPTGCDDYHPLVGWCYGDELTFLLEGYNADTACVVDGVVATGLCANVVETSDMAFQAMKTANKDDLVVSPLKDQPQNANQIVRSNLNSIAFRFDKLKKRLTRDFKDFNWTNIKCDGGVSNNDYLLTAVSHLSNCSIYRDGNTDSTALGCAFLAGLACGIWRDQKDILEVIKRDTNKQNQNNNNHNNNIRSIIFQPNQSDFNQQQLQQEYQIWLKNNANHTDKNNKMKINKKINN